MSENPYQTPTVSEVAAPLEPLSDAAQIRQKHLRHEASLKGMGSLFFLGGVLFLLSMAQALWVTFAVSRFGQPQGLEIVMLLAVLLLIPLQFICWWGLRKLKSWVSIPAGILSGLGLFVFPVGTILGVYFLYLLFSQKGRMILSPVYQEIIAQTPGMKYRTPIWIWILLVVIVLLIVGAVMYYSISAA
jgi:hypothetical protein